MSDNNKPNEYHRKYSEVNLDADKARDGRLDFVLDLIGIKEGTVLDIGCGPGVQFLAHMNKFKFTGIDISEQALTCAQDKGYKTLIYDVSKGLPFDDNSFDIVVMTDILEHLFDPLALILEAQRTLRLGGYMVISVPNHFYLLNRLRILRGKGLILPWDNHQKYKDWNYFHIRFFRWKSLCSLLSAANLCILHDLTDHFKAPLPFPLSLRGIHRLVRIINHFTRNKWRDIWTLHFLVICQVKD